jgi:hypothetical protein
MPMQYAIIFCFSLLLTCKAWAQTSTQEKSTKPSIDSSELYGLIPEMPIKVGGTYIIGVANQKRYLEALRDAQGKPVTYARKSSCCPYPSENGFEGHALLDKYEVKYRDANNKKHKAILYISFYDYEEPKAVKGFTLMQ